MKKLVFSFLVLVAILNSQVLLGQNARNTWGLGINPGVYSFYALQGNNIFNGKTYGPGVNLALMGYLGKAFDLGVETNFARLVHPLDVAGATSAANGNYTVRENYLAAGMSLRFRFDNGWLLDRNSNFVPFIKAGVGGNSYGKYTDWSIYVPVGLGVMLHVPKTPITFTLQTSYNPVFLMPDGTTPSGFLQHSIGMTINFGKHKNKDKNAKPIDLANKSTAPDRDYDGVPDEVDHCPDIYGSTATMGCPDSDGDGIKDTEDKCPDVKGFANLMGCLDSDYDGIIDPEDECPDVYGETETGCPGSSADDTDGDGVPNAVDLCPDEKGLFTAKGCPDRDGDGVRDADDECPDYYGLPQYNGCPLPKSQLDSLRDIVNRSKNQEDFSAKGYTVKASTGVIQDQFGNKLKIDNDGDIADANGKKMTTSGGYKLNNNQIVDANGKTVKVGNDGYLYADNKRVDTKENLLVWGGPNVDPSGFNAGGIYIGNPVSDKFGGINLTGFTPTTRLSPQEEEYCQRLDLASLRAAIYFDTDHANPNSIQSLNKIVEAMRRCAILELQIAGHTDSDGTDNYNLSLSERRAQAVMRYITGQGINDRRLKYNAYGEKYPVAPNTSDDGKQQNRRAEVRVQRAY